MILADATGDPDRSPTRGLTLTEDCRAAAAHVPLPDLRKDEQVGPHRRGRGEAAAAEREEHWRLLYVAMTRAEEALFIGGALGKREKRAGAGQLVCAAGAAVRRRAAPTT